MGDYKYTGTIDSFSGEPNGSGTAYFVNGDYYEGEFENGEFNGEGTFKNIDRTIEKGIWEDGELVIP